MNKAVWAIAAIVPVGAAAVFLATRGGGDELPAQGNAPAASPPAATAAPEAPSTPVEAAKAYDPGRPTPEISAERIAIEKIGKEKNYSRENEARLVKALDHIDQDVRGHAAWGLGEMAPDTIGAIPALIKALGDPIWAVQHNAAWAFSKFSRADVEPLLLDALRDPLPVRRIRAAKVLLDFSPDVSPEVEPVLLASYQVAENQPRMVALMAMGQLSPVSETTVATLGDALGSDDETLALNAANSIGELGPAAQSAIPMLVAAAGHKKSDVRRSVASALGLIGVKSAIVLETLVKLLDDPKDGPADEAAQALSKLDALDALADAYANRGPRTRKNVVNAWRASGSMDPRRIEKLIGALADSDPSVRLAAAGAFLERDVPEAVPALAKAVGDSDGAVAGHARTALERMANPAAKSALAKLGQ